MKAVLIAAAVCIAAFALGFAVKLQSIPIEEMRIAEDRLIGALGGPNQMRHGAQRTHETRGVVMPSPDLLYSACPFDLSQGPVRVVSPATPGYHSVSVYAHNSDNVFTVGGAEARALEGDVTFVLTRDEPGAGGDATAVQSPTDRGLVLVRRLIGAGTSYDALRAIQAGDWCGPAADAP